MKLSERLRIKHPVKALLEGSIEGVAVVDQTVGLRREAADLLDERERALAEIIKFSGAKTFTGTLVAADEQYPSVATAMRTLTKLRGNNV